MVGDLGDKCLHRILVKGDGVTAARERIERVLGVETETAPYDGERWFIDFAASRNVDLDFLRPDVLPPRE